jgi:colicin import membrane protein
MIAQTVPDWRKPVQGKNWGRMLAFSLLLHLLLLVFFIQVIPPGKGLRPLDAVTMVNLISPGEGPAGGSEAARAPVPGPPVQPVSPKHVPLPRPVEKLPPSKIEDPQSLEKALEKIRKKIDQEKNLERSFHQLENKVKNQETLGQAMARLERRQSKAEKTGGSPTGRGEGGEGAITAAGQPGSGGVGMQFQIYHAALRSRIKKNWFLPEGLLKKAEISADVLIRIAQSGRIEETRFERKSGNESFDQEVLRTLKKSEPLPPLPEGYPRNSYEVVLTFHSKDLGGQ